MTDAVIQQQNHIDGLIDIWRISHMEFEWDTRKGAANRMKHDVSFLEAQQAFLDENRIIATDVKHSTKTEKI